MDLVGVQAKLDTAKAKLEDLIEKIGSARGPGYSTSPEGLTDEEQELLESIGKDLEAVYYDGRKAPAEGQAALPDAGSASAESAGTGSADPAGLADPTPSADPAPSTT